MSRKPNITKYDLCKRVSKKVTEPSSPISKISELSQMDRMQILKPVLDAFLNEILDSLAAGHKIEIRGFGCFKPIIKKKRLGRNPRTCETVDIPAHLAPTLKFSKEAQKIFEEKRSNFLLGIPKSLS